MTYFICGVVIGCLATYAFNRWVWNSYVISRIRADFRAW
jgi:hypothetical protein